MCYAFRADPSVKLGQALCDSWGRRDGRLSAASWPGAWPWHPRPRPWQPSQPMPSPARYSLPSAGLALACCCCLALGLMLHLGWRWTRARRGAFRATWGQFQRG